MKKYLYFILLLSAISLTGCGTKEVVYDAEETVDGSTDEEEKESETGSGSMLSDTLGVTDNNWKEEIGSGTDKILVRAVVEVPEVTDMYTQEVTEHYYTPEEQKEIAEYFLDADTIQVNKKAVITKEWVQKALNYFSNSIQSEEEYSVHANKFYMAMLSTEKKRLEALINEVPSINDVSDTVQDFSENHYIGSKGDVKYTLSFDMDEAMNTSSWTLEAVDGNDFTSNEIAAEFYPWYSNALPYGYDNICEMSREEACAQAEELCRKLGIDDMKVSEVYDLELHVKTGEREGIIDTNEYNGYSIELARNIKGLNVDIDLYYGDGTYLNTDTMDRLYDMEKVVVKLNDKGIICVTYEGCMIGEETGKAVKLLSYAQIQEILREEMKGHEGETKTWKKLSLVYIRVIDEASSNRYCYIPAWHLGGDNMSITKENIWINAMDGSRIDPDKAGFAYYVDAKEHLKNMWIYFDQDNLDY